MNTTPISSTATTSTRIPVTLRAALLLDAAVTGVNGLAYVVAAGALASLLGPSAEVLLGIGGFLLVYAIGVALVGNRRPVPRRGAGAVVSANLLWVAASLAALVGDWLELTTVGTIWLLMQAVTVGGFAALQALTLRTAR